MASATSDQDLLKQFEAMCDQVVERFGTGNVNDRINAQLVAQKTSERLMTPRQFATAHSWAPIQLSVATLACEMNIFKAVAAHDNPQTVSQISKQVKGQDEMLVQRIMRLLAAHNMVDQPAKDAYAPNSFTRDYTTDARVGNMYFLSLLGQFMLRMPYFYRANGYKNVTSPENSLWMYVMGEKHGTMWDYLKANEEDGKHFNDYMTGPRVESNDLSTLYPFDELLQGSAAEDVIFVDVGGGFGHQCVSLRKTFPRSRGKMILQDLPVVIENHQVDDVEVMAHDMFTPQPIKGARIYYFRGVCHDHNDDNCRKFLGEIAKVMAHDSRLLIHDLLIEDANPSQYATRADFVMNASYGAMERTEDQMRMLVESVGLRVLAMYKPGPEMWTITECAL